MWLTTLASMSRITRCAWHSLQQLECQDQPNGVKIYEACENERTARQTLDGSARPLRTCSELTRELCQSR